MTAKKIIITGGATRIGAAIAESLANYDTEISIHYNKSKSAASKLKNKLEKFGSQIYLIKADLNNFNQTQNLLKVANKKMKGVDCLINNASVFENDDLQNFSEKSFIKHININLKDFVKDPYPFLKEMQKHNPICYVPELDATLLTKRDDIFINEKKTEIFSSLQPDGLMTQLMGENMMRKAGQAHLTERKAIFPSI